MSRSSLSAAQLNGVRPPHNSRDAATNTTSHEIIRNPQEISHTPHKAANATPQEDSHKTFREAASTHAFQGKSRENPAHISHTSRELSPDATSDASRETSCDPDASPISCDHPMTIPLAIQLVHHYSQQLYEPPQRLYTEVVRSIQDDIEIKDGIMRDVLKTILWRDLIETSFARQQKLVIFNLLEHMGVSEWFERQVCHAQETFHTARHQPYKPRAAATKVLDIYWETKRTRKINGNVYTKLILEGKSCATAL
ncbi:hypothetical protein BJX99DRAFT_97514 [Aspergillus californicus]